MWHIRLVLICVTISACHGMDESTAPVVGQVTYRGSWPCKQRFLYTATAGWVSIRGQKGCEKCSLDGSIFLTEEKSDTRTNPGSHCLTFLYSTYDGHLICKPLIGHCQEISANGRIVALITHIERYPQLPLSQDEPTSDYFSEFGTLLFDTTANNFHLMHGEHPQLNADGSRVIVHVHGIGPCLNLRDTQTGTLLAQIRGAEFQRFNNTGTVFAATQTVDCVAYVGLYDTETGRTICIVPGFFAEFSENGRYMLVNSDAGEFWQVTSPNGDSMRVIQGTFCTRACDSCGQHHTVTITGEKKTTRYDVLTGERVD